MNNTEEKIRAKITIYTFILNELNLLKNNCKDVISNNFINDRIKYYTLMINELRTLLNNKDDEKTEF